MREVAHRIEHARESLRRQGVDPDAVPWDYEKLAGELRPDAERVVRRALLLEAIAAKEELAVGDADVDAEVARLAQESGRAAPGRPEPARAERRPGRAAPRRSGRPRPSPSSSSTRSIEPAEPTA